MSDLLLHLRPHAVWVNKHTHERTVIRDFAARTERVPVAAGGFADDHQLVVYHTANVPPGFKRGYGDDALTFVEHWEPLAAGGSTE